MECEKNCRPYPEANCGCVGYAYVPYQYLNSVFAPKDALLRGTVFPELELTICEYGKVCKATGGAKDE